MRKLYSDMQRITYVKLIVCTVENPFIYESQQQNWTVGTLLFSQLHRLFLL